eukprot:gene12383-3041_t
MKSTILIVIVLFSYQELIQAGQKGSGTNDNRTVTIIFGGDISFDGPVKYFAEVEKTCDYKRPFEKVRKLLATADLRVANLESPLLKGAYIEKVPDNGKLISHYGSIDAVEGLKYAGFDIVQVANNHFADFGVAGVKSTIAALKKAGIAYVGMQDRVNKKTSQKPVIKTVNGLKIGFLSYCLNFEGCNTYKCENEYCHDSTEGDNYIFGLGPAVFDKRTARNDIKRLSKRVDFTVVLMHWSQEYLLVPPLGMREIAESLVVFGATLVMGGHPHVIQGHECRGTGALVVYSLGNFLFPKHSNTSLGIFLGGEKPTAAEVKSYPKVMKSVYSPSQIGMMFRVTLGRAGILAADYIPFDIKNDPKSNCLQPTPLTKNWIKFCGETDLHCINFRDVCASMASTGDAFDNEKNEHLCIKGNN